MKRSKTPYAFVVVVAVLILTAFLATRESRFAGPRPPNIETPELPDLESTESHVTIPITIPLKSLEDWAEDQMPSLSGSGSESGILWGKNRYSWKLSTGAVRVGERDGGVRLTVPVTDGSVTREWSFDVDDIRGRIVVDMRPRLTRQWILDPNLATDVDIDRADVLWAINTGAVRKRVESRIQNRLSGVSGSVNIRAATRRVWRTLCRSASVPGFPGMWLRFEPQRLQAAQPSVDAENIRLHLRVTAQTQITSDSTSMNCRFPQNLTITELDSAGFSIAISTTIDYEALSNALAKETVGKKFGSGTTVSIESVSVSPYGTSLLLRAGLEVGSPGRLDIKATGTVYILAAPQLDTESQTVSLTAVEIDTESRSALVAAVGELSESWLQEAFNDRVVFRLRSRMETEVNRMNEVLQTWGTGAIGLEASIDSLRLTRLDIGPSQVRIVALMHGNAAASVQSIPIARR